MREPDIGTEVTGIVPETGDQVEGTYLGSIGEELAVLLVGDRRVAVSYGSLEELA
jgi:hypothetical protein